MSRFMIPATSNEPFIEYEVGHETFVVPANVAGTLPEEAKVTDHFEIGLWFARLSAPGYLDATDWTGPQPTEGAALYDLWTIYGESEETFTEFVEEK